MCQHFAKDTHFEFEHGGIAEYAGPTSSLCAHGNARFRLQTPGQRPGGPKAISYQSSMKSKLSNSAWPLARAGRCQPFGGVLELQLTENQHITV
jgi:hypothetical protein